MFTIRLFLRCCPFDSWLAGLFIRPTARFPFPTKKRGEDDERPYKSKITTSDNASDTVF